ncbi:MAG TPA: hypothetical protein VNS32_09595 [Flavisolibacter sp.]|nr:hypothetical protein [Flavisolibacter sp.]
MDRCCDQSINMSLLQRLDCSRQGLYCIFASGISKLAGINNYLFFPAIINVDLLDVDLTEIFDTLVIEVGFRYRFTIKIDQFIRSEYDRRTMLKNTMVCECLDDQFWSYPIYISTGNSYNWLIHILKSECKNTNMRGAIH